MRKASFSKARYSCLNFLADSAVAEEITKDSEHKGTRILMDARMDNVRLQIQIDFGVGDVIVPAPRIIEYPVLLSEDTIKLIAYPVETAIAEKLQAMVALGSANSRMKDFYDVWICSNHLDFTATTLLKAVEFDALTSAFAGAHRLQWNAFVKKIGENHLNDAFGKVVDDLKIFAMPVLRSLAAGEKFTKRWKAGTGWVAG